MRIFGEPFLARMWFGMQKLDPPLLATIKSADELCGTKKQILKFLTSQ